MEGCCSCTHLKEKNKKDGKVSGCVYFCAVKKKYVNGKDDRCEAYKRDPIRKTHISNEIYHNGRQYYNDKTAPGTYLMALVIIIIIGLIITIFG